LLKKYQRGGKSSSLFIVGYGFLVVWCSEGTSVWRHIFRVLMQEKHWPVTLKFKILYCSAGMFNFGD